MRILLLTSFLAGALAAIEPPGRFDAPPGLTREDLASWERAAELVEAGPARRLALLEKIVEEDDLRLLPLLAMYLADGDAERLHEERCGRPHLGGGLGGAPMGAVKLLCGLSARGSGYSDRLRVPGGARPGCPVEWELLAHARESDDRARFAALALLFRVRAAQASVDVVDSLRSAPLDRMPWLAPLVRKVREETSWSALRDGVARGDGWSLGACLARRHPETVEALTLALADPRVGEPRTDIVWVLGRLGDVRAVPVLIHEVLHGNEGPAAEAADALRRLGDPRSLPALRRVARWEGSWRQGEAVSALGTLGENEDLSLLEDLAGEPESRASRRARLAFDELARRLAPQAAR